MGIVDISKNPDSKIGLLFIGQAPSKKAFENKQPPFSGEYGEFLAELMGSTQENMLRSHDFIHLIERWPGKHPVKGDLFPMTEAKRKASELLPQLSKRVVVLVGYNVARAFSFDKFEYFKEYSAKGQTADYIPPEALLVIPQPSHENRWYNNPNNKMAASKILYLLHSTFRKQE